MSSGEFKKRVYEQGGNMLQTVSDVIEIDREKFDAILDEITKEFPLESFTYNQPNKLTKIQLQYYYDKWGHNLAEIVLWFRKWFVESTGR